MAGEEGHVKRFRERHLKQGEQILHTEYCYIGKMMGSGDDQQHNGAAIVTNQRVVFYRKRMLGGDILQSIPLNAVTSIELKTGALSGAVTLHTSHDELTLRGVGGVANRIQSIVDAQRTATRGHLESAGAATPTAPAVDAEAALDKLADLRAKGLITPAEFDAKRAEILARI